jgi:hypothetical protein
LVSEKHKVKQRGKPLARITLVAAVAVEVLQLSSSDSFRMTPREKKEMYGEEDG